MTPLESQLRLDCARGGLYASTQELAERYGVTVASMLRTMNKLFAEGLVDRLEGEAGKHRGRAAGTKQPKMFIWVTQ